MLEAIQYLPEAVNVIALTAAILKVAKPFVVENLQTVEKGAENFPAILRVDQYNNSHVFIPTGAKIRLDVEEHCLQVDDFRYDPDHGHFGGINITVDSPVWPYEVRNVNEPFVIPELPSVRVTYFGSILNHEIWRAVKSSLTKPKKIKA